MNNTEVVFENIEQRLLKEIERKNQSAKKEDQEILSRYVGWGGLQEAFDATKTNWSREYNLLKDINHF